jgi:hypothetical protein
VRPSPAARRRAGGLLLLALIGILTGCAGSSDPAASPRTPPDLAGFLRHPVATPSSCPPSVSGSTSGRRSPWVGHVDVSVFVADRATTKQIAALRAKFDRLPEIRTIYFESSAKAYAEFQRLYTCSVQVPRSAVPASFRLLLHAVTRSQRDELVRSVIRLPAVASVSCDPSSPCVNVRRPTG